MDVLESNDTKESSSPSQAPASEAEHQAESVPVPEPHKPLVGFRSMPAQESSALSRSSGSLEHAPQHERRVPLMVLLLSIAAFIMILVIFLTVLR